MTPQRAATVGLAVLEQLVAVHSQGMLHGDIRPGSVLVGPRDRVTLVPPTLRSPAFTAPEGVTGTAADLWALGATLYFAVEGRSPGQGGPPGDAGPLTPVLLALLSPEPGRRPEPGALHEALLDVSRDHGALHTPLPPVPADVLPPPSRRLPPEPFPPVFASAPPAPPPAVPIAPAPSRAEPAIPITPAPPRAEPAIPITPAPPRAEPAVPARPDPHPAPAAPGRSVPPPSPTEPSGFQSEPVGAVPPLPREPEPPSRPEPPVPTSRELVPFPETPETPSGAPMPTGPTERSTGRSGGVLVPRSVVGLTCGLLTGMAITIGVLLAPAIGRTGQGEGNDSPASGASGSKARFAAAPRACGLLDEKQASQLVPGFRSSEVEPPACDWLNQHDWRLPGPEKFDLRVRLVAQKQDASGIERAKEYLAGKRKDLTDRGAFATPKPAPPQNLSGVGESAFSAGRYDKFNIYGGAYKVTVVFRISNLIAEIEYLRGGVTEDSNGEIERNAVKAARWIAESLKSHG